VPDGAAGLRALLDAKAAKVTQKPPKDIHFLKVFSAALAVLLLRLLR
jgi:hypothetical protein